MKKQRKSRKTGETLDNPPTEKEEIVTIAMPKKKFLQVQMDCQNVKDICNYMVTKFPNERRPAIELPDGTLEGGDTPVSMACRLFDELAARRNGEWKEEDDESVGSNIISIAGASASSDHSVPALDVGEVVQDGGE